MADQGHRTADVYKSDPNLPFRFNNPDCIRGYSEKKSHPLYRTSNQEFGSQKPTVHEMPTQYKGSSHKFSTAMLQSGMYHDNGFNTSLDRSRLILSTATQKKRDDLRYYYQCVNQINDGNN